MKLWIYLHFPHLQLNTLFSEANEQVAVPICIIEKHQIVQLNESAASSGVKIGMGLGSAAALCSDLQVHPYQHEVEEKQLKEIAQWIYLITSDIVISPPQGLLLRIDGMLTLYNGLEGYWQHLSTHLNQLGIQYRYSTGFSPISAKLLAEQGHNLLNQKKDLHSKRLASLPLHITDLSTKTVEKLARVGIKSIEQLLKLDMADIARRFDIDLVNYVGRLTGHFHHPVDFYLPPAQFSRYLDLLYEIQQVDRLNAPLKKLFEQLDAFLKIRDQVAFELTITLHQRDKKTVSVTVTSAQGDYQAERWAQLSALTLESIKLTAPILALTLCANRVEHTHATAHDLFDGEVGQLTSLELISTLSAKLGQDAVHQIKPTYDPRPEFSTLTTPFMASERKPRLNRESMPVKATRPSFLLNTPQPLTQKVTLMHGPERIATGWWDNHPIIRDYFIAYSKLGQWLWVFRTPNKKWFVHGLFS